MQISAPTDWQFGLVSQQSDCVQLTAERHVLVVLKNVPAEHDGAPWSLHVRAWQQRVVVHDPVVQSMLSRFDFESFCPSAQNDGFEFSSSPQVLWGSQQSLPTHADAAQVMSFPLGLVAKPAEAHAVEAMEVQSGNVTSTQHLEMSAAVHPPVQRVLSSTTSLPLPQKVGLSVTQSLHFGALCSVQQSSQLFKLSLSLSGHCPHDNPGQVEEVAFASFDAPQ